MKIWWSSRAGPPSAVAMPVLPRPTPVEVAGLRRNIKGLRGPRVAGAAPRCWIAWKRAKPASMRPKTTRSTGKTRTQAGEAHLIRPKAAQEHRISCQVTTLHRTRGLLQGCGGNVGLVITQAFSVSSIQHSRNYEKSPLAPDATLVFSGRPLTTRRSNRFRREGPAAPHSLQETQNAQHPDRRRCLDVLCCSLRKRMDEWKPAGGFFQGLPKDGISAKCFGPEVDPVVLSARFQVSRPESRLLLSFSNRFSSGFCHLIINLQLVHGF
ncbi:hypothetical protein KSP39_PZI009884 [Platanthera zijinensis]|uniref:Uncharacterized protein n=1 Tax=Platanthera zijinensis TaxID=2320716 RepID=A0AAP0G6S4_9ASPA